MTDNTQPEAREFTMSQYASKDDMIGAMRKRIAELESELEAVGAGGVQALRKCLHHIEEPLEKVLERLHAENATLQSGYDAARLEIESLNERIAMLVRQRDAAQAAPAAVAGPCPTCVALARTVMLDQVSFDRKPDCYGIRQITDDESVEEWEDIRTSPDVAREEANDMMATGRGEIYEVVPLWTTPQLAPQPAPAAQGDALNNTVRVPLDSLHADAAYLIGRLQLDTMDGARVVEIIRERIEAAKAALAAQAQEAAPAAQGDARAEQSLLKVLTAVQRYLPPDGPSAKDTLSEIIGIVDPWPLGDLKGKA